MIQYSVTSNFFIRPPISTYLFTCKCHRYKERNFLYIDGKCIYVYIEYE